MVNFTLSQILQRTLAITAPISVFAQALVLMCGQSPQFGAPTQSPASPSSTSVESSSASSHKYYVSPDGNDGHDGSAAHPWKTIQHAANVVTAGSMVVVAPGTYTETVESARSGSPGSPIRFVSANKWSAVLDANGQYTAWHNTGNYVEISDFQITRSQCLGINDEGSYVRISGNHVHHIPAPKNICHDNGGSGIVNSNYMAHEDRVIGNVVHDIGTPSAPDQSVHGIYHSNTGGLVANNLAFRNAGWGIHLWHSADAVIVANNTVFNNGSGGILVGNDRTLNDHTLVARNIVTYNGGFGISENTNTGTHNRYVKNLLFRNTSGNFRLQNGNTHEQTIDEAPLFVNYTGDGNGDYHLAPNADPNQQDIGAYAALLDASEQ